MKNENKTPDSFLYGEELTTSESRASLAMGILIMLGVLAGFILA